MIICFSGNGNTLAVARRLADDLADSVVSLCGDTLLHPAEHPLELSPGERVVWTFPVYSWGVPPVVRRFIRQARIIGADLATHFMVATMGDDAGLTADMWRADLAKRSWHAASAFGVIMPNTYVCFPGFNIDSPTVAAAKLQAMPARVTAIAQAITQASATSIPSAVASTHDDIHRGALPRLKTRLIYPLFVRFAMSPSRFRVDPAKCIACARCARHCPLDNITLQSSLPTTPQPRQSTKILPHWGNNCATCLACFHICPTGAISRGPVSRGKSRYPGPNNL
ncbi:MAG: EFR1 family ferrodoxin [Candidatus Amulumruptor caecigallinarius]|nr:EFR1 family ferrodoxin [Candidatus Amulumruptor caecigallinarius]MCM1397411.1 EFR1 family ferrodoxin [Candidatus Amulumruptor caecigallinarius]MCM1454496.1 EFR1 family ferrodoxin [bacterium]